MPAFRSTAPTLPRQPNTPSHPKKRWKRHSGATDGGKRAGQREGWGLLLDVMSPCNLFVESYSSVIADRIERLLYLSPFSPLTSFFSVSDFHCGFAWFYCRPLSYFLGSIPIPGWWVVMVLNQAKLRRNYYENSRKCTKQSICFRCLDKIGDLRCRLCGIWVSSCLQ